MTRYDRLDATALLILRLGCAWFIFLWAAHKLITPGQYQGLARNFDGVELSLGAVHAVAWVQVAVCALAAIGFLRWIAYGGMAVMHAWTVSRRWDGFFDPFSLNDRGFPVNRNQVIDLAVLAALISQC